MTMKLLLLTAALAALAAADVSHLRLSSAAAAPTGDAAANILKQELDVSPDGGYRWAYEADNGIAAEAQGQLKPVGEDLAQVVQGAASWNAPNGERISLQYTADENGYQPQGEHLPTPPPVPAAILRALEYIQAHPPQQQDAGAN